jgi:transcriptional regulator with XRE-family HTH domain
MTSFPRETFASRMKRFRLLRSYTQEQLSIEVCVSQGWISKIERGLMLPDIYTGIRIASVLRFPLKGLVEHP